MYTGKTLTVIFGKHVREAYLKLETWEGVLIRAGLFEEGELLRLRNSIGALIWFIHA